MELGTKQVLVGIEVTLFSLVLAVSGGGAWALLLAAIGLLISLAGALFAPPPIRTPPLAPPP